MSDDDWGDDGGGDDDWGDDAGGDDAWGEDGGDDWADTGDADFGNSEVDVNDINIQVANTFYEAESVVKSEPKKAMDFFIKVIELSKGEKAGELNDESRDAVFQSQIHRVVLLIKAGEKEVLGPYKEMMSYFPNVSHNDSNKAVDTVLHALALTAELSSNLRANVYEATVKTLEGMANKQRMTFDIQMRRCNEFVAMQQYEKAKSLLQRQHQTCLLPDGSDDQKNKGSELMDIYALEMKIAFETKTQAKTKELYKRTKDLTAAVNNPKSLSIIRECWGKMFGDDGNWQKAHEEFFKSFITYQEAGQSANAKKCLNYVVVSNMLAGGVSNPFDAREAAVFQNDDELKAVSALRKAYEKKDVTGFTDSLTSFKQVADDWIMTHMGSMITDFHKQYIMKFVQPYRRLRIDYLAKALRIEAKLCEDYLVQLVLDGEIQGRIDQVQGLLDMSQRNASKRYQTLETWCGTLETLTNNLPQPNHGHSLAY